MRRRRDDHGPGFGKTLQARGEVRRIAEHRPFLCRALADHVDDDEAGGNADPRVERDLGAELEAADRYNQRQPGANRTLRIILMRGRIAEIDQHAIAEVACDKAAKTPHLCRHLAVISGNHCPQILGIELRRECGRADEVAEPDGHMPALGGVEGRGRGRLGRRSEGGQAIAG
jgi:hypothetical protein